MSAVADARPKHLYHCINTVTQFRGAVKSDRRARAGRGLRRPGGVHRPVGPPGPRGPRVGALNNRPSNGSNSAPDPDPGGASGARPGFSDTPGLTNPDPSGASGAHDGGGAQGVPQRHVTGRVRVEVCPNLLQRPGSSRSARRESLVFRGSSPGRSRRGAPLQQIWTTSAPSRPRSLTRPTAVRPHPHDEQERPVGGAPRCHHAARRGTHPANLRLLRPFPSATPLHPPMYEKKERSGGRGGVAEGKRRSRRLGAPSRASSPRSHRQCARCRGESRGRPSARTQAGRAGRA